jgi:hypothetical protein
MPREQGVLHLASSARHIGYRSWYHCCSLIRGSLIPMHPLGKAHGSETESHQTHNMFEPPHTPDEAPVKLKATSLRADKCGGSLGCEALDFDLQSLLLCFD